jgi:septal ring factor EnvC (AmiA/AmiB activator)
MAGKRGGGTKVFFLIVLISVVAPVAASGPVSQSVHPVSHYDQEIKRSSTQLATVREELEKGRLQVKSLEEEEGSYLLRLEQLEKNISTSHRYLSMLQSRIDTVEKIIVKLDDSLNIAKRQLNDRKRVLQLRLRQAYMNGPVHPMLMIFSASTPLEAVNRVRYMEELNRYDRDLVGKIEMSRRDIDTKKAAQRSEHDHLAQLMTEKEKESRGLVGEEQQRKLMLTDVRKKKDNWVALVKELESSQKELLAMIRLLEEKRKKARVSVPRKGASTFEKSKGALSWPVDGVVVTRFGKVVHPEYQTVIMSNGIDIKASVGGEVHCVASGTVIHTGSMRGLGKMVIVEHTGGFMSIYAHLSDISVVTDQKLTSDSVLGRVGDTGSLGGAKLHFEIRKSAEALNPAEWLEKR